jgi:hypothetical protein
MIRACITCKDEYTGDSWGVNPKGLEYPTLKEVIVDGKKSYIGYELVCYYCYFGEKERQWKPEWRENNA